MESFQDSKGCHLNIIHPAKSCAWHTGRKEKVSLDSQGIFRLWTNILLQVHLHGWKHWLPANCPWLLVTLSCLLVEQPMFVFLALLAVASSGTAKRQVVYISHTGSLSMWKTRRDSRSSSMGTRERESLKWRRVLSRDMTHPRPAGKLSRAAVVWLRMLTECPKMEHGTHTAHPLAAAIASQQQPRCWHCHMMLVLFVPSAPRSVLGGTDFLLSCLPKV